MSILHWLRLKQHIEGGDYGNYGNRMWETLDCGNRGNMGMWEFLECREYGNVFKYVIFRPIPDRPWVIIITLKSC